MRRERREGKDGKKKRRGETGQKKGEVKIGKGGEEKER